MSTDCIILLLFSVELPVASRILEWTSKTCRVHVAKEWRQAWHFFTTSNPLINHFIPFHKTLDIDSSRFLFYLFCFITALLKYDDKQRIEHIQCVQFDEFGHRQTPIIPSPQSKQQTYLTLPSFLVSLFVCVCCKIT